MRINLCNQTWIVTGISSGIGWELTKQLLEAGTTVIGIVRRKEAVLDLLSLYPELLRVYEADLRNFQEVESVTNSAFSEYQIDVAVSNAGICLYENVENASISDITSLVNTNLTGAMVFLKACVSGMKNRGGKIIQMGSVSSQTALPGWAYYCATKYGIAGFCEALALETKKYGISVMVVEPGNVNTSLWNKIGDDKLKIYSEKADVSVKKLARRVISVSGCEEMPMYLPLGSRSSERMVQSIQNRLTNHQILNLFAGDVDEDRKRPKIVKPKEIAGRDIYVWPLGDETIGLSLYYDWTGIDVNLKGYLDSDVQKVGSYFCGRLVRIPQFVRGKSSEIYVIIGSKKYYSSIKEILETYGYSEKKDFCYWRELIEENE